MGLERRRQTNLHAGVGHHEIGFLRLAAFADLHRVQHKAVRSLFD